MERSNGEQVKMSLTNVQEIALRETSEYFDGDPLAPDVFMKYALRNEAGELLETNPDQMHRRLAKAFAHIESKYPNPMSEEEIYGYFKNFADIVPQGSPMSGIGNPYQIQSLSNCFVIDSPKDSYGGILFSDQEQVQIMKRRGGVGFDVSNIRPKGLPTSNAARTTDGIGVFMERFSNSCREVAQGGRRGALMLSIDCRHPEIETFINIKRDLKKVTGANISIRFTDEFMHAVKSGTDFTLRWPVEKSVEDAEYTKTVSAKAIWDQFVDAAWSSAEPGALFWDNVTKNGTADIYESMGYKSISTNPCVTGDTLVLTNAGEKTVKELAEQNAQFFVESFDTEKKEVVKKSAVAFKTKDDAKILELKTKSGKKIRLTPDHRVYTQRGWVEAADLTKDDKILSFDSK
jgi:ribonucleoside-diphosphate reductase alpha chain